MCGANFYRVASDPRSSCQIRCSGATFPSASLPSFDRLPLTLVTGPANAAKAGSVLGAFRARLDEEPLLVVPRMDDIDHHQRELAGDGALLGGHVVRFAWLFEEIATRCGFSARRASRLQVELIAEEATRRASLITLSESAERPGFAKAATRLFAELERSCVEPGRLAAALKRWAPDGARAADPARAPRA